MYEMGLYGSPWSHIEGIRRCTVDLEVYIPKYKGYILKVYSKMGFRFWDDSEKNKVQT